MQEILKRMIRMDQLIQIKATGTPAELARRVGVSERSVYEYLNIMKKFGAPIMYSRGRKSYSYENEGSFTISFISIE